VDHTLPYGLQLWTTTVRVSWVRERWADLWLLEDGCSKVRHCIDSVRSWITDRQGTSTIYNLRTSQFSFTSQRKPENTYNLCATTKLGPRSPLFEVSKSLSLSLSRARAHTHTRAHTRAHTHARTHTRARARARAVGFFWTSDQRPLSAKPTKTPTPSEGFDTAIPALKRPQIYALSQRGHRDRLQRRISEKICASLSEGQEKLRWTEFSLSLFLSLCLTYAHDDQGTPPPTQSFSLLTPRPTKEVQSGSTEIEIHRQQVMILNDGYSSLVMLKRRIRRRSTTSDQCWW